MKKYVTMLSQPPQNDRRYIYAVHTAPYGHQQWCLVLLDLIFHFLCRIRYTLFSVLFWSWKKLCKRHYANEILKYFTIFKSSLLSKKSAKILSNEPKILLDLLKTNVDNLLKIIWYFRSSGKQYRCRNAL